ncbi:MAG: NADH-quinone oxidoreductase subunit N [Thermodesulfobacteriota bacterium]
MMMITDWLALLPYLILAAGGTLVFFLGALVGKRTGAGRVLYLLAFLAAVAAGAVVLATPPGALVLGGMLDAGPFPRFFTLLLCAVTAGVLLFGDRYSQIRGFAGDEYFGVLLFAALGMCLVSAAGHWLIFFLGLELFSLALYLLIAAPKGRAGANEAAIKYFIMGAVASAVLTFGLALLYAMTGTLEIISSLAGVQPAADLAGVLLALGLILVGVGFKLSFAPFHLWTPDVYQGAPAPVTAFLSAGSKVALFAALSRFCLHLSPEAWSYCWPVLWAMAAVTMVAGNVTAVYQTQVKRLLAYSSIGQMGYLLMALVAVKQGSLPALMFYLVVYAVMDLGAFSLIGVLSDAGEDRDNLEDFRGLGFFRPWWAAVLVVCLISLAGLPPTGGFLGKLLLFKAVFQGGYLALGLIGILTVIISIFAYLKIAVALYLRPATGEETLPGPGLSAGLASIFVFLLIFWLGLAPTPLMDYLFHLASLFPWLS